MLQQLQITDAEYFALPYASNSGLKDAHKMFTASDTEDWAPNQAYEFGSAFDALLTNPGIIDTSMLSNEDRRILPQMRRSLEQNDQYNKLFAKGLTQVVFVDTEFQVEIDGVPTTLPAKCKYDFWAPMFGFGADLKSVICIDQRAFESACGWFKYYMQAAWYMDITKSDRFMLIGISKKNYKIFVIQIRRGDKNYLQGKKEYTSCARSWWILYGINLQL